MANSCESTPLAPLTTPWGSLVAYQRKDGSLLLEWAVRGSERNPTWTRASGAEAERVLRAAASAIDGDERAAKRIETPLGTPFQMAVWNACRSIPNGQTRTYGWIAKKLGRPTALCRAIGQAMKRNPLPMIVPCHRVVAADGLGGYAGATDGALLRVKCGLLELESCSKIKHTPRKPSRLKSDP